MKPSPQTLIRLFLFIFFVPILVVGLWVQPAGAASSDETPTYLFGGDASYSPYEFIDEQGNPTGFNVDLLRAISGAMGLKIEIRLGSWGDIRQGFNEGLFDGVVGMVYSPRRDNIYDYSVPHSTIQYAVFARRGNKEIQHLEELYGHRVLIQRGGIMQDWLEESGLGLKPVLIKSSLDALRRLEVGKNEYALLGRLNTLHLIHQKAMENIVVVGDLHLSQDCCFVVRPDNQYLLQVLNEGLSTLKASGEYNAIAERWFGVLDSPKLLIREVAKDVLIILLPLVCLLVGFFLWTWMLRRQVRQRTLELKNELSERKRAEQALWRSQEQLQAIVENTPAVVTLCDRADRLIMVNRHMEKMFGLEDGTSLVGQHLCDIFSEEYARPLIQHNSLVFEAGHAMQFEELVPHEGGAHTYIAIKVPLRNEEGSFFAICCVATDITQVKQAEEEKRRMEAQMLETQKLESLGVMAGGIAHDFNNLLMGVLGHVDLIADGLSPNSHLHHYLGQVETASRRAADLCMQMLAYAGKGRFKIQHLRLSSVIDEMADLIHVSISKNARLELRKGEDADVIEADASQIRQVVLNLIINASEALGPEGGHIWVKTGIADEQSAGPLWATLALEDRKKKHVMLEVSDDGVGMDEDLIAKIFDPFFSTKFTGRGLGLAAVQGIIKSHHGVITVESEPGKGTTFRILLPRSDQSAPADETQKRGLGQTWTGEGKVLVVDDETMVLEVASKALSLAGFTVLNAIDGEEAVETFLRHPSEIILVLLDLTMPGLNGMETLKQLREIRPDIRVLFSSGYSEEEATLQLQGESVAGFIQKPYRTFELIEKVKQVLQCK